MPPKSDAAAAGVVALVASIRQHQKFRAMASYSVQCLCRAITPPTVGWERNLKEAHSAGALTAIDEVLQRHKGDEAVQVAVTACFTAMAHNAKYAEALVDSGAVMSLIDNVTAAAGEGPAVAAAAGGAGASAATPAPLQAGEAAESMAKTLTLFETIATSNPDALLRHGGARSAVKLLRSGAMGGVGGAAVALAAVRTLEKLNKVPGAAAAMMAAGAVEAAVDMAQRTAKDDTSTAVVECSLRMLDRMCRTEEQADYIRAKCDGMAVLSTSLEANRSNERICKAGGKVLTKLASGNVGELVTRMGASKSTGEKEFLAGLLSNLALEEESADMIVSAGGVSALLKTFEVPSKRVVESSARAIARLATSGDAVDELVRAGAVDTLVTVMASSGGDAAVVASITPTLTKLAAHSAHSAVLFTGGAVGTVVRALADRPTVYATASDSLAFLENLLVAEGDAVAVAAMRAIPAIVTAMAAHPAAADLQLNALRCLIVLAYDEANVGAMVSAGVMSPLYTNLGPDCRRDVVLTALYLVTSMSLVPATLGALRAPSFVHRVLPAVAANVHDAAAQGAAEELLAAVIGEEQVAATVADLSATLATALASRAKADATKLKEVAVRLGALAAVGDFADMVLACGGAEALIAAMNAVTSKAGLPDAEGVLAAVGGALTALGAAAATDSDLMSDFLKAGAVQGIIASMRAAPKLVRHVACAVKFMEACAVHSEAAAIIVEEGGVEACTAAMRANGGSQEVVGGAVSTMLALAATEKGAVAVARHGGTRQVIASVAANAATPNFVRPMEKALALLQRVASTTEGADTLSKQGGVEAAIQAAESVRREAAKSAVPSAAAAAGATAADEGGGTPPAAGTASTPTTGAASAGAGASTAPAATTTTAASAKAAASASAKLVARLVTGTDVTRATSELAELVTSATRVNRVPPLETAMPVLSRIGNMVTAGNYAVTVGNAGGTAQLTALARLINAKCDDSKPADADAKATLLPAIFKALAAITKAAPVTAASDSAEVAALVAHALEDRVAVPECLACVATLAVASPAAAATLLADGHTLTAVNEALRTGGRDTEVASACFTALSALAAHVGTVGAVSASPALTLVASWIDDHVDDAPPDLLESALGSLERMARGEGAAARLLEGGALELVKALAAKCSADAATPTPGVLSATVGVLQRLTRDPAAVAQAATSGTLRRIVRAAAAAPAYAKDEGCVAAVMELLVASAAVPAAATELAAVGAQELIVAGMNANGTSAAVLRSGAAALAALGAGEEAARICAEEVHTLTSAIQKSTEVTEDAVAELGAAVQRLGNFMMIPGVVSAATAPALMTNLSAAVGIMAESEMGAADIMAAAVQSLGRLVEVGGAATEGAVPEAVSMVMDVVLLNPNSAAIRESAVHALGALGSTAVGMQALHATGAMSVITEAAASGGGAGSGSGMGSGAGDAAGGGDGGAMGSGSRLVAVAEAAAARLADAAVRNAAAMVSQAGGSEALAGAIAAAAASSAGGGGDDLGGSGASGAEGGTSSGRLESMLTAIVAAGGEEALYDVVATPATSMDVLAKTLHALREAGTSAGGSEAHTVTRRASAAGGRRMRGLAHSLTAAVQAHAAALAVADGKQSARALEVVDSALTLLEAGPAMTSGEAEALVASGSAGGMVHLLAAAQEDVHLTGKILTAVAAVAQAVTPEAAARLLGGEGALATVVSLLRAYPGDATIASCAVEILAASAGGEGGGGGLDAEVMRAVSVAASTLSGSVTMRAAVARLQAAAPVRIDDVAASAQKVAASLDTATASFTAYKAVDIMRTDAGEEYYYDPATDETTWEAPPSLTTFREAVASAAAAAVAASAAPGTLQAVPRAQVVTLVDALGAVAGTDVVTATAAATALEALLGNDENAAAAVEAGALSTVVRSASAAAVAVPLLVASLGVMEGLSRREACRPEVVTAGGLDLVVDVGLGTHLREEGVASKSLTVLANLSTTPAAVEAIMAKGGPAVLSRTLVAWEGAPRMLETTMRLLSNLMYDNTDNNLALGRTCGGQVSNVVRDNPRDAPLLRMALRALGNLACCDANVRPLVEANSATKALVASMRANLGDEELLRSAVEVLGNFAALEEVPEVDADGEPLSDRLSIAQLIMRDAGCAEVISSLKRPSARVPLVTATLTALTNLAGDSDVAELMVEKQGLLPAVVGAMARFDWDGSVVAAGAATLAAISYSAACLPAMAAGGVVDALLGALAQHPTNRDLLSTMSDAMLNLAADEDCRAILREGDGVQQLVAALEANAALKPFVEDMFALLRTLAADATLSATIGELATQPVLAALARFQRDPDFVNDALRLITTLSYVPANLTVLVQLNGIARIIGAITEHPEQAAVIVRGIQTLDAVAMTSKENAAIVIEEGGKDLIEMIMEQEGYLKNEEVQRFGKSALLSMAALDHLTKSAEITARAARAAVLRKAAGPSTADLARAADPLADVRNMMTAGKIMKLWTKGSTTAVHLLLTPDLRTVAWQDVKTAKRLGGMDFGEISAIRPGYGDGHKKSKLEEATCFVVAGRSTTLDLECNTAKETAAWVDALQRTLRQSRIVKP